MENEIITIAFVDDILEHRQQIRTEIEKHQNLTIVAEGEDGRDILSQLFKLQKKKKLPQILLLDIQMPKCCGLVVTILCKWFFPSIKVVGLSVHTTPFVISQIMVEGADGFLSKFIVQPNSMVYTAYNDKNIFMNALLKIINGEKYIDELLDGVDAIDTTNCISCSKVINTHFYNLKPLEIQFILLNGAGFTRKEIATFLNFKDDIIIKNLATKIYKQFNLKNHDDLNRFAVMNGLLKFVEVYQKTAFKNLLNA